MRICLLSSERSGSNLLRLMLGAHSNIAAPAAPQIARILAPKLYLYGDLADRAVLQQLIRDALLLVSTHPQSWNHIPTVEEVEANVSYPSFWIVFAAIYDAYTLAEGKKHWFCKENNLFDFACEISESVPDAQFIYLVRDGRDYVTSMRKVPGGSHHYYFLAKQWQDEQARCLNVMKQLQHKNGVHLVRYEDLLGDPAEVLNEICKFIGIDYEPAMLRFHEQDSARQISSKSEFWKNLSQPLMQNNFNKFKQELSRADIELIESIAGLELSMLGYDRMSDARSLQFSRFRLGLIQMQEIWFKWNQRRKLLKEPARLDRSEAIRDMEIRLRKMAQENS